METGRNRFFLDLRAAFLVAMLLYSANAFGAADIFVPDDYITIQEGIDAASDGDTVVVRDGSYAGVGNTNLDFRGKSIVLRSENGPETCIIDARGTARGVVFQSGETSDAVLSGFTILNGNALGSLEDGDGGGILCVSSSPVISNCIITGSRAKKGGGIYCESSSPIITNCTVTGNNARQGGGLFSQASFPEITNGIFWANGVDGLHEEDGAAVVTHSDVEGGHEGTGNIDADPSFVDPEGSNFGLRPSSPCIDAGDNNALGLQLVFASGPARIANGIVDMGATEYETSLIELKPVIISYLINNGDSTTTSRTVTLNNSAVGAPTHYMAGENSEFNNATWKSYSSSPELTLSKANGDKTVYFKVKNNAGESAVKADFITLKVPPIPSVSSFQIDNGASTTSDREVTLNNTAKGSPTHYMAGESSDFAGKSWKAYSKAPSFTLSSGNGEKTVYFKVKNSTGVSDVVSDTITFKMPPKPSVTSFKIENGASSTSDREVTLNNTTTGSPTHYMASESSDFKDASWQAYSESPGFTLSSGNGKKTVYFKVKNGTGASPVLSDSINLNEGVDITGVWSGKWKSKGGESGSVVLDLKQSGNSVSGTMDLGNTDCGTVKDIPITGTISNNVVDFQASHVCQGTRADLQYTNGVVSGNTINGQYSVYTGSQLYDSGTYSVTKQ